MLLSNYHLLSNLRLQCRRFCTLSPRLSLSAIVSNLARRLGFFSSQLATWITFLNSFSAKLFKKGLVFFIRLAARSFL